MPQIPGRRLHHPLLLISAVLVLASCQTAPTNTCSLPVPETRKEYEKRMQWWDEARFGLFIHWGVMAVPGGIWKGRGYPSDWIRFFAEIPLSEYRELVEQFNPTQFHATEWVRLAKDAGMKYIVITAKHHDGFCLFDSKDTDFDIMSTPFKRDILGELADACRREGIRICWYYSIMDWDHPDYLPRMRWETDRSTEGADFERYFLYLKSQIRELLTNYGDISVLWFDGEWEEYWTVRHAQELYAMIRSIQSDIIINDRLHSPRSGMLGYDPGNPAAGDFGTQEHAIPADQPRKGVCWETCETLNTSFAYTSFDGLWKSPKEVVRVLAETASKGGNFLLGTSPDPQGVFPQPAQLCLREVGRWLRRNGESIYGADAGMLPQQEWGFCTRRQNGKTIRVYLHVCTWPLNGVLRVHGLANISGKSFLLCDPKQIPLLTTREEDALLVRVPLLAPDTISTVVVLELADELDAVHAPRIQAETPVFLNSLRITISSSEPDVHIMFTMDGSAPTANSPVVHGDIFISSTSTLAARCYRHGTAVSEVSTRTFEKIPAQAGIVPQNPEPGIMYSYYTGVWWTLPDFSRLFPVRRAVSSTISMQPPYSKDYFGFVFDGYLKVPSTGIYRFATFSDDGSQLFIDNKLVVNNDTAHVERERIGHTALEAGYHKIRVTYFECRGDEVLRASWRGPNFENEEIPASALFYEK